MEECRISRTLKFGYDPLRQGFAQLDSPLVKRINIPYDTLRKYAVLVQRDQASQRVRCEPVRENRVRWAIAFEDAMRDQTIRNTFSFHLRCGLAEGERFGLGEEV